MMPGAHNEKGISRRGFLQACLGGSALAACSLYAWRWGWRPRLPEKVFIGRMAHYQRDIAALLMAGFKELGVDPREISGKRILLKPNMVDVSTGKEHINTHPLVIRGAAEAFLKLGASRVTVAEGTAHTRDTLWILEECGLAKVLNEDKIPFIDVNYESGYTLPNAGGFSRLDSLTFPVIFKETDWVVSLAKLKTHHWAGVTLSMKNLFGAMPGIYYGFPKNILHKAGIDQSIVDINLTLKPHFAIIDGIIGMEGDGPIMGTPKPVGVMVMGRNLPAVDATAARIMGINPEKIRHLAMADARLGPVHLTDIRQVGESITAVASNFQLSDEVPVFRGIRL